MVRFLYRMTTEEKTVSTDPPSKETDEKPDVDISAKAEVLSLEDATEDATISDLTPDIKEDTEPSEIKSEETEEGFETPEEGEGDGGAEEAKLDDDQDIESPAYIPKTGKYYMHDSREDTEAHRDEKKSRADGVWSRDRYDERNQQPRSRRQMIEKYGFDIRLGETKEMAEDKEKEMKEAGIELDDEEIEKVERKEINKQRDRRMGGDGIADRGRGPRRQQPREEYHVKNGEKNDDDEIRPAARRDTRRDDGGERGNYSKGGREGQFNRNGGRGEGTFGRSDRGRGGQGGQGGPQRPFNRTFSNSNRNNGREENKDGGAPKRYSTQRGEKSTTPAVNDQPTDIGTVYFDPTKQTPRENRTVIREKKPLEIVPPPS